MQKTHQIDNILSINNSRNYVQANCGFELLNKGSIVNFRFNFSGIIALERVNIYFKSYYLKNNSNSQKGVFSGIDNENRLVNGTLSINYKAD